MFYDTINEKLTPKDLGFEQGKLSVITEEHLLRISNGLRQAALAVALVVSVAATALFDSITFPCRYLIMQHRYLKGVKADVSWLSEEKREALATAIRRNLTDADIKKLESTDSHFLEKIMGSYSRSRRVCGPVVMKWADHLLERASKEGKKLVFMARDGTAPYLVAKKLLEKNPERYPNISSKELSLAYFSRKAVENAFGMGEKGKNYIKQYLNQLGVNPGDKCILVDSGYQGSMIPKLKELLDNNELEFEYLISLTKEAEGFLGSPDKPLLSVKHAAGNYGIMWLEGSLQGTIKSPKKFVRRGNQVYPSTLTPTKLATYSKTSQDYLIRKWSLRGILDSADETDVDTIKLDSVRKVFDKTLGDVAEFKIPCYWANE
jgi:hypothetical protein